METKEGKKMTGKGKMEGGREGGRRTDSPPEIPLGKYANEGCTKAGVGGRACGMKGDERDGMGASGGAEGSKGGRRGKRGEEAYMEGG